MSSAKHSLGHANLGPSFKPELDPQLARKKERKKEKPHTPYGLTSPAVNERLLSISRVPTLIDICFFALACPLQYYFSRGQLEFPCLSSTRRFSNNSLGADGFLIFCLA